MKKITWIIFHIMIKFYWPLQRIYTFFISLVKNENDTKIFCIGAPKTGTSSLHKALKILGYRIPRIFDWATFYKKGEEKYIEKIKKSCYNAFIDFPFGFYNLYEKIDVSIPNSKFILTVREPISLEKSHFYHFKGHPEANIMLKTLQERIKLIEERNNKIIRYFNGRDSQLLIMNITNGDGWYKLCDFLEKKIPNIPFPHKNIGRYKK